jgi:hypothetical protein
MTFWGQAMMHSWHPLHRSVSTTMAPFIFAILYLFNALTSYEIGCKSNINMPNSKRKSPFSFNLLRNRAFGQQSIVIFST